MCIGQAYELLAETRASEGPGTMVQTCQKYWVGKPNYWGQKVVKSDKCMGVSQLLGGHVPVLPPKVYAYGLGAKGT